MEMEDLQLSSEAMEVEDDCSDIRLRLIDLSDIDDLVEWVMDEKVSKFCSWDYFPSREAAMNYVANVIMPHPSSMAQGHMPEGQAGWLHFSDSVPGHCTMQG